MVRLEGFETLRSRQREEDGFSPVDMISHAHFCFHLLDQRSRAARLATVRHPRFRARRESMGHASRDIRLVKTTRCCQLRMGALAERAHEGRTSSAQKG